jgi:hypothetical protein
MQVRCAGCRWGVLGAGEVCWVQVGAGGVSWVQVGCDACRWGVLHAGAAYDLLTIAQRGAFLKRVRVEQLVPPPALQSAAPSAPGIQLQSHDEAPNGTR